MTTSTVDVRDRLGSVPSPRDPLDDDFWAAVDLIEDLLYET